MFTGVLENPLQRSLGLARLEVADQILEDETADISISGLSLCGPSLRHRVHLVVGNIG
jgi:hypothetical protein